MFESCLVIREAKDQDADEVTNDPDDSDTGHHDQLQHVLDPANFCIRLASALPTAVYIPHKVLIKP